MQRRPIEARTARNGERGSALVEFAFAMPIMLALAGAIIDGGWALHQAAMLSAAAEAAQRAAALQDTGAGNCSGAPPASYVALSKAAAASAAPALDASRLFIGVRYAEPACTGRMRTLLVNMSYSLRALTPWFASLLTGRAITAQAGSAVEEVPPPWWSPAAQAQRSQITIQPSAVTPLQSQLSADQSTIASQQSLLGTDQAQIASLGSAYQAMQSAASYYYTLWQQVLMQLAADGIREQ
jgi:Flp pilus assembly protein TadG